MNETRRPRRLWYALAGALMVAALVVVAVGAFRLFSAVAAFEIEPVPSDGSVTVGERPLAVWQEGAITRITCTATDESGAESSRSLRGSTTVTLGARTWHKVTVVEGPPGSTHQLSCTGLTADVPIGTSDDPDMWGNAREIILTGLLAGLLCVAAVVTALVVWLMRRRPGTGHGGSVVQSRPPSGPSKGSP